MRWARGLGGASWWPFGLAAVGNEPSGSIPGGC